MKKNLRHLACAAVGVAAALGFTSCAYDPYYSSSSVGASYSTGGYGHGYGYGSSGFSTSVFVSTGDPVWGYDPTCYSYYNYRTHCYYDPYSYGYYPVGYRPPVVYGVPHPHGWHPGGGHIRPPVHVTNVTLANYQNRESRYRNSSYGWARQVRQQPVTSSRQQGQRQGQIVNGRTATSGRTTASRPPSYRSGNETRSPGTYSRQTQPKNQGGQPTRGSADPAVRKQGNGLPSRYNTPVAANQQQARQSQRAAQANKNNRQQPQGNPQKQQQKQKQSGDDRQSERQYR